VKAAVYAALCLALLPHRVVAADKNNKYEVLIPDREASCQSYVSARAEAKLGDHSKENKYVVWLSGYFTAYNFLVRDTYDLQGAADSETLLSWLDSYCKTNPRKGFADGVEALTLDLYSKRTKEAPVDLGVQR
jgi:hypothetical protein